MVFSLGDPNVFVRRIEASFRKRNISESTLASLAVVLKTCTCRHTVRSPLDCKFRGMCLCMARSVLVSTVRKLGQRYVGGSVARGFISCRFFEFAVMFCYSVLFALFRWCCPSLEGRMYGLGKGTSSQRSRTSAGLRGGSS